MLHASRPVSTGSAGVSCRFGSQWFFVACLVGTMDGCDSAPQWTDAPSAGNRQDTDGSKGSSSTIEDPQGPPWEVNTDAPILPTERERTTVVCECDTPDLSSLMHSAPTSSIENGTSPLCPPVPCKLVPGLGKSGTDVTLYLTVELDESTKVLDEPILTITGTLQGSSTAETSTRTIGPLTPVSLENVGQILRITVDAPDFANVTNATVSWIPRAEASGGKFSPVNTGSQATAVDNHVNDAVGPPQFNLGACCEWCCDEYSCVCRVYAPNGTYCP